MTVCCMSIPSFCQWSLVLCMRKCKKAILFSPLSTKHAGVVASADYLLKSNRFSFESLYIIAIYTKRRRDQTYKRTLVEMIDLL
jgi:hypothetical protein